jgi:hypothetical protein
MVSSLVLVACGCPSFLSMSSAIVSANTKQNRRQNRGVFAHKGAQTSTVIRSYQAHRGELQPTGGTCERLEE